MRMHIAYNIKAYINGELMQRWIEIIYTKQSQAQLDDQQLAALPHKSILFLDNCRSHLTADVKRLMEEHKIRADEFPPNCTPILQPTDHSVNNIVKRGYEEQWRQWYAKERDLREQRKGIGREQIKIPSISG